MRYNILAYDLEGTEVAEWLNTIGVTGIVLKYRVPVRDPNQKWQAPVQDAQRAISLVRNKAQDWKIDPLRIGVMGFSRWQLRWNDSDSERTTIRGNRRC